MLAVKKEKNIGTLNTVNNVIQFPVKEKTTRRSTRMWCLKNREEITAVFNVFNKALDEASTSKQYTIALRNLTMFVCAINIGLRGGDFCSLKWSDIYDDNWNFRKEDADFVPKKTKRCGKHIVLTWNSDFEYAMSEWLNWNESIGNKQNLDDYIFTTRRNSYNGKEIEHISEDSWYRIVEKTRKEAGIKQKIGTHGLRKTMANQYITRAENQSKALREVSTMFGHADLRTTEIYSCLDDQEVRANKENLSFLY